MRVCVCSKAEHFTCAILRIVNGVHLSGFGVEKQNLPAFLEEQMLPIGAERQANASRCIGYAVVFGADSLHDFCIQIEVVKREFGVFIGHIPPVAKRNHAVNVAADDRFCAVGRLIVHAVQRAKQRFFAGF